MAEPFESLRRLTGCNLFMAGPGAAIDSRLAASDPRIEAGWRECVAIARAALDWPLDDEIIVRPHAQGLTLVMAAPMDQLYTACDASEWALLATLEACGIDVREHWPQAPGHAAVWDQLAAMETLRRHARAEAEPKLAALAAAAREHGINLLVDEDEVSLGSGRGVQLWPMTDAPAVDEVDWSALSDIPRALITGSNGKTTTTRLLAAILRASGKHVAHSCTDGVFLDGEALDTGDYSGPGGARMALRQSDVDVALLETARGGLMRRGIAPQHAEVAVVTNVSVDHFGEYGINNLDDLAQAKLTVARPLGKTGLLVSNGDDAVLMRQLAGFDGRLALFAVDADSDVLAAHRQAGGITAGVRAGRLVVDKPSGSLDLGEVAAMPLTHGGTVRYNIANIAGAALAALALEVPPQTVTEVLRRFGATASDNPGRLERYRLGTVDVLKDYAHNPDGMRGLVEAVSGERPGRLGMVLAAPGDRRDEDIRELTAMAATARPNFVVLNSLPGYLRGREAGAVPAIMRDELRQRGLADDAIVEVADEWQAALRLLAWARPGDRLLLQVLGREDRERIAALLQRLVDNDWQPGQPLPDDAL